MSDNNDPWDGQNFDSLSECADFLMQNGDVSNQQIESCENGSIYPDGFTDYSGDEDGISSPKDSSAPEANPSDFIPWYPSPQHDEVQNFLPTGKVIENNQCPVRLPELEAATERAVGKIIRKREKSSNSFYRRDGQRTCHQSKNDEWSKWNYSILGDLTLHGVYACDENVSIPVLDDLVSAPRYPKTVHQESPTETYHLHQVGTPDFFNCNHRDIEKVVHIVGKPTSQIYNQHNVDRSPSSEATIPRIVKVPRKRAKKAEMQSMSNEERMERKRGQNKKNAAKCSKKKKDGGKEAKEMVLLNKTKLAAIRKSNDEMAQRLRLFETFDLEQVVGMPVINVAPNCIEASKKLDELKKKVREAIGSLEELKNSKPTLSYSAFGSQKCRKLQSFNKAKMEYQTELCELHIQQEIWREEHLNAVEQHLAEQIRRPP